MRERAARAIVALRWVLVPLWIVGAVLAYLYLPSIRQTQTAEIGAVPLPTDAPALQAELLSKTRFPFPLVTRYVVVLRDEDGLAPEAMAEAARTARDVQQGRLQGLDGLAAVAPVPDVVLEPGSRPTTILYYLYFRTEVGRPQAVDLANRFAAQHVAPEAPPSAYVGVTGSQPAAEARSNIIPERLPWVTGATALLVALAVALHFRSPVAPLVNLAAVAIAYLVASHTLGWLGQTFGFAVPREVEPVAVVLLFGVVTDYSIFFLSRFRDCLSEGLEGRDAAGRATADVIGIVIAAALVVALATSSLLVAKLTLFQVFGPALGIAVLVGALVAATFVPAALAIGGRFVLWPNARPGGQEEGPEEGADESEDEGEEDRSEDRSLRARVARLAVRRPLASAVACVLLLGAASTGLLRYELANPLIQALPADAEPQRAYAAATAGFPAAGAVSPTVAVVREPGLAGQQDRLAELGRLLEAQPGVAAVFGPGDVPDGLLEGFGENAFVSESGDLARFLVITEEDPLDERAVGAVQRLEDRAPALLDRAGLGNAELLFGGDTAISAGLVERTFRDLGRVAPVALLATFLALALYLRSLVAPLYLVAASVLALLAALGLSAYLYEPLFGPNAVTFFVPFAVAILLLALGSDYNVFLTGRVWEEARGRPLNEAVEVASTRAAGPIATAGLILAGSFALLAIVPLATFRVVALTMALGLLLDAFLVRQLLVPALIVLVGRVSGWPGRRLGKVSQGRGDR